MWFLVSCRKKILIMCTRSPERSHLNVDSEVQDNETLSRELGATSEPCTRAQLDRRFLPLLSRDVTGGVDMGPQAISPWFLT